MGMSKEEKAQAAQVRDKIQDEMAVRESYRQTQGFDRFAPSKLQILRPELKDSTSFLGGAPSPYAQSLAYQALPGMTYANRPGTTEAFYPQANIAPPSATTPPASGGISNLYKSEPAIEGPAFRGREISEENQRLIDDLLVAQNERDFDEALKIEDFIKSRDMLNDGIFKIQDFEDYIGGDSLMMAAEGGIASLPVEMSGGGMPGGMDLYGGSSSKNQNPYESMTKEQLISLLEKQEGANKTSPKNAALNSLVNSLSNFGKPQTFADGGNVDFPRMNGPISGPGTETSDDIPAMLSDGEFVVNAKAVRGVGKLNGADGSKEEQRRNGARMMYALQKAGEQAMRKA